MEENFRARARGEEVENNYTIKAVGSDGNVVPVEISCSPFKAGERVKGVIVCIKRVGEK